MRLRRSGDLPLTAKGAHAPITERFWRNVEKTDGCWWWGGSKRRGDYGVIGRNDGSGKNVMAHRFSYELHKGAIPDGMIVMHSCDNPACVNPDHLSVGTHKDNTRDMIDKGRRSKYAGAPSVGAKNGRAVLNDEKVRYIRAECSGSGGIKGYARLARELGVSEVAVRNAALGKTWSHVK
jgi:hypothetical protein